MVIKKEILKEVADATIYYRPSNNLSITTVAGINEVAANIFISSTGETRAQQRTAFIQTRVQSGNLFMQYNYTDTANPTEDKYVDSITEQVLLRELKANNLNFNYSMK